MKLIVGTNDAFGRSRYDIHEVVFVRRQHIEPPAGKDRSLIDRQILGATKARAAKSHLRPGFNSPGLSRVRIDYREVADTRHFSTLLKRMLKSCDRGLYHAARTFPFVSGRRKAAIAIVA